MESKEGEKEAAKVSAWSNGSHRESFGKEWSQVDEFKVPVGGGETASQPSLRNEASNQSPSLNLAAPKSATDPPDVQSQLQTQTRPSESIHPVSGSATSSPPPVWEQFPPGIVWERVVSGG